MTDPKAFDEIARRIFAPAYPVIAEQIIEATGIKKGFCLDIGCGGGHLGMALAKRGPFDLGFLDPSQGMRELAVQNVAEAGLSDRVRILEGCAESIPLPDHSVDLAISRGSIFFWKDLVSAFKEIYRVLKPGGKTYIGGGFGSDAIKKEISRKMEQRKQGGDTWKKKVSERLGPDAVDRFNKLLTESGIPDFAIFQDQGKGLWIMISKGEAHGTL
ncbi:MAG: class I SAM-dependent methyltransferase [Proteobacteria bacterium]|nr:class I SAM-dependent methyltransferase [Pseudomonadota bacterium]